MSKFLTSDRGGALPIHPVRASNLSMWLDRFPRFREWLSRTGFEAEPGTFAFLPRDDGQPEAVVAAPAEGAAIFAFAGLPMALPEGKYVFEPEDRDPSPTDTALGWMLGSYAFRTYREPKRAAATLVWPAGADQREAERISRSVFLARDMINTPAEDMGPDHLAEAGRGVAKEHGAALNVVVGDDLLRQNYPTIHIVGRASHRPPRLIDLRWGDESAPKVTLVGKGVCFDTGGLDLKPREG